MKTKCTRTIRSQDLPRPCPGIALLGIAMKTKCTRTTRSPFWLKDASYTFSNRVMADSLVPLSALPDVWQGDASVTLAQWLVRLLLAVAAVSFTAGAGVGWCTAGWCLRRAPQSRARAPRVPSARDREPPAGRSPLRHRSRSADAAPATIEAAGWLVSVPSSLKGER